MSDAVEEGLLTDATSRNALYKIHVSLGKIVNSLDEQQKSNNLRPTRSVSASHDGPPGEDRTVVEGRTSVDRPLSVKEEQLSDGEGDTVLPKQEEDSCADDTVTETWDDTQIRDS